MTATLGCSELVTNNPKFSAGQDEGQSGETSEACPDDCIVGDESYTCEAGVCSGVFEFEASEDSWVGPGPDGQDENFNHEGELGLFVGSGPPQQAFIALAPGPDLPMDAQLVSAELLVTCVEACENVGVHAVLEPWAADELTWFGRPMADVSPAVVFGSTPGVAEVELSSLAEQWLAGGPNNGICLRTSTNESAELRAIESGEGPVLRIELTW